MPDDDLMAQWEALPEAPPENTPAPTDDLMAQWEALPADGAQAEAAQEPVPQDQFVGHVDDFATASPGGSQAVPATPRTPPYSFVRDLAQMGEAAAGAATNLFGAGPYIEGAMGAAGEALTGNFDVPENFERYRQGAEARNQAQMRQAPLIAGATELVGGMMIPAARGGALLKSGAAALEGGTTAALQSESDSPVGVAEDFAMGAGLSGGLALAPGAGRALGYQAGKAAKPVSKYLSRAIFGADPRAIQRYENRLSEIEKLAASGGADYEDLAEEFRTNLAALRRQVSEGSTKAFDTLPENAVLNLAPAREALLAKRQKLVDLTGEPLSQNRQEVKLIDDLLGSIEGMSEDVAQIRRLQQSAQRPASQLVRETPSDGSGESPLDPFLESRMRPQMREAGARPSPAQLASQVVSRAPDVDLQPWLADARRMSAERAGARPTQAQLAQQGTESAFTPRAGFGESASVPIGEERSARIARDIQRFRENPRVRAPNAKRLVMNIDRVSEGKGFAPGTHVPAAREAAFEARQAIDSKLKTEFPEYEKAMMPLAEDTAAINAKPVKDFMGKGQRAQAKYLRNLLQDADMAGKGEIADLARVDARLGREGSSVVDRAMDQRTLDMFGQAAPGGSRRTNLGEAWGRRGGFLGAAVGATVGALADISGPAVGRAMLRGGIRTTDNALRILTFLPKLEQASPRVARMIARASESPDSARDVVTLDYVMQQQDPEYRALRRKLDEQAAEAEEDTP